ncbi:MAG: peptidase [Pseudomonadota bacterium]|jgi:predicted Zn-dependent protease
MIHYIKYKFIFSALYLAVFATSVFTSSNIYAQNSPSSLRHIVSAEQVEAVGTKQYSEVIAQAKQKGNLLDINSPVYIRVNNISNNLIKHIGTVNPRAKNWKWEVNVIKDDQTNAFCMPSGKIAVYTGIIDKLNLTDAELAVIMGHEISHALQEHAREQMAKQQLTNLGAGLISNMLGLGDIGQLAIKAGAGLLSLKFSRDDETDADIVGLNISTKAGYDPRASIVLWQKMIKVAGANKTPQWISTHPIGKNRIKALEQKMPELMPVFAKYQPELAKKIYISNTKDIPSVE